VSFVASEGDTYLIAIDGANETEGPIRLSLMQRRLGATIQA
jgi:hypothetical protein